MKELIASIICLIILALPVYGFYRLFIHLKSRNLQQHQEIDWQAPATKQDLLLGAIGLWIIYVTLLK